MKKILSIYIIGIFFFSCIGAIAIPENVYKNKNYDHSYILNDLNFSEPIITNSETEQIKIDLKGGHDYLSIPGKSLIPKIVRTIELPFGVTDINIEMKIKELYRQKISKKIISSPIPVTLDPIINKLIFLKEKQKSYSGDCTFPSEWFSYNIGVGFNKNQERITFLTIHIYPVKYNKEQDTLIYITNPEISILYNDPIKPVITLTHQYDLLIIAPEYFSNDLQELVDHKNNYGISTFLKTTNEIYSEFDGRDKPEQIKLFIKDSIEKYDIKYVLLVGGLKSIFYAKPKDDKNHGSSGWHLPVRYSNNRYIEPGYLCDLYYADIYKEGGEFDDWDSNGNNIFAENKQFNSDVLDLYPDVAVGRLACRNIEEVKSVVNKIINYESGLADSSWFKKIVGISGDSFLDQDNLNFQWNVKNLSDGDYTIFAQSKNDEGESGSIESINIVLDRTKETMLTFNHDDNLRIDTYPGSPMAEIVSISEGNILGNTDYSYIPIDNEAYCNEFTGWGNIDYIDEILAIRGKSYDPKLYGNITDIHVWIENTIGDIVFDDWRYDTKMFSEGDWIVGEKYIHNRGGAMYYMPDDFERVVISTSNGRFSSSSDVIDVLSEGSGFVFFSVHGSPGSLGNHLPGIPGNRRGSSITGLLVTNIFPYFPFVFKPVLPMKTISNSDKLPVVVVGLGCHDANFNVTMVNSFLDLYLPLSMHTYGHIIPECLCWYFVKLPDTGAIASIGYSDYGIGNLGEWFSVGGYDGWISTEFFRQYGEEKNTILGVAHSQSISNYITHFKEYEDPEIQDYGWDWADQSTVEGWVLLGDPSLQIGGYP
jgi:hypothetical protein